MRGFIIYPSYLVIENETYIQLIGRLENGQSFMTLNLIKPYFFIKKKDFVKYEKVLAKYNIEETDLTNFKGENVIKISAKTFPEINKLYQTLHHQAVETYEADIRPYFRFTIDNDILASIEIRGEYNASDRIDRIYKNPEIKPANFKPRLKILSIDTESDRKTGEIYCIGLYSEGYEKSFMITQHKLKNTLSCKNEEECLHKFREEVIKFDPDVLTGWNVIDFDLSFLKERFARYKIPFDIGRTEENVKIRLESNFFKTSNIDIPGRQVLDGLSLIRDPFIQEAPTIKKAGFDSYTLEEVAKQLLGKSKLITGKDRHNEIDNLYKKGTKEAHQKILDYNITDCLLAYEILEKAKMLDLAIERSELTGMPFDRLTSSIASFDSLYIREARKRKLVSPTTRYGEKETRIKGGYVYSSKAGIFYNVLILDFKSLYPSIIKTFNIDPASYLENKQPGSIEAPNGAHFKNTEGILPTIIEKLHQAREKAKKEKRELSSYAIKVVMNSFFGVLASPNCRYFNLEIANAITHFGQMIIQLTAKEIEKLGYRVIYQDTDSVFVETNLEKKRANQLGLEIQEHINKFYEKYIKENYNRKSYLELQFTKQYISMMIPGIRNKEEKVAAKKRYAGLIEKDGKEEIEIIGLEAIRGDWTEAAGEFQLELLRKIFKKEPFESFIKSYVQKILEGKLDSKLVYRKTIRKALDEYTKTTPPHVKAARKLGNLDSKIIQYYITTDGPEPIQKLKHKIDYEHYIEKQIKPIANQVLDVVGKSFEEVMKKSKQTRLF